MLRLLLDRYNTVKLENFRFCAVKSKNETTVFPAGVKAWRASYQVVAPNLKLMGKTS